MRRLREAGLIWPGVAALLALAVLIALGAWQWQRKAWKEGLIARIAERTAAAPVSLDQALQIWRTTRDVEYLRVFANGQLLHEHERYLYSPEREGLGWHVLTPLEVTPDRVIWVNRGFVIDALRDPARRSAGQIENQVRVTGLARLPASAGPFTPANDPARNIWYWRDLVALQASAFQQAGPLSTPFMLDAEASVVPGGWPKGGVTRLDIPNRHLEYALTWWGLAATLVGVFGTFAWSRLRR